MAVNIPSNALSQSSKSVFVDLTQEVKSAQIMRRGYQGPAAKVDVAQAAKIIGDLQIVDPKTQPRVISQTIAPGTKVTAGTAIDLVLAPKSSIPLDIFQDIHSAFKGKALTFTDPIAADADARKILLTYERPEDVPAVEKAALTGVLARNGVSINESQTNTGFNAAFNTMRSVMAFQE
ncbi:MAG: PASTA domain-containing protein [Candidatus Solibacter sp.]|nr:PASTA domain-containing protein [Candidatus Solibacter sp.]